MNKQAAIIILLLIGFCAIYYFYSMDSEPEEIIEDIPSYNISNRYECYQIKNDTKYNECVSFYLKNVPYKAGDKLVATR